jgi:hypothetical protein
MGKTVGGIGILNSDLFSDQFFLQCFFSNIQYKGNHEVAGYVVKKCKCRLFFSTLEEL